MHSSLGAGANPESRAMMDQVTHIVVDEVHERDIDTDLSLVVLKRLLADRKARGIPLKVILMSATIDPTLFQNYFADAAGVPAPVASVPGRTFPVTRHWLNDFVDELRADHGNRWVFEDKLVSGYLNQEMASNPALFGPNTGMDQKIPYPLVALTIAHVIRQSTEGHVLVFLPGWDEIKKVSDTLLSSSGRLGVPFTDASKFTLHYLHSSIPAAEQKVIFSPPPAGVRRIILATNIAETSVTIPDVVYVVDTGRVKESRYDADRHVTSLVAAWVGSSNLNQRAGRAGRHRSGEYFALVSKNRRDSLHSHQMVEMKRSDLSNVVMHVKVQRFPFISIQHSQWNES
jgi:HrpA-like RNA helicase